MQAKDIKEKLRSLIQEAFVIDHNLARKLEEIDRWIKDVKPGSLTAKKFVVAFLLQIIRDANVWLKLKAISNESEQQLEYERMTPTERYWYSVLFPRWINGTDPKFLIWKQKLMSGEFHQADAHILQLVSESIIRRGGTVWQCYIADLSMATDFIASSHQTKPLCIQITSLSEDFSQEKYHNWLNTLQRWGIERGIFLSYNPLNPNFCEQLVNMALYNSDNLPNRKYIKFP